MKQTRLIMFGFALGVLVEMIVILLIMGISYVDKVPYKIYLPEEIQAASTDSNHPDTTLMHISRDTVHIRYTGKHR